MVPRTAFRIIPVGRIRFVYLKNNIPDETFIDQTKSYIIFNLGYLLTKETIRLLVEKGIDQDMCKTNEPGYVDDVIIGLLEVKRLYFIIRFY